MEKQLHGIILDVDGTLVDSNDAQAYSWVQAMADYGNDVSFDRVRPLIGMGGDKVLPETLGITKESEAGKQISQRRKQVFKMRYLPTLHAFPQTRELLEYMHEQGLALVIATSAAPDELHDLLQVIGPHIEDLLKQEASSKDVKQSKPDPDVMHAALQRTGYTPGEVLMIGDTSYDIESATQAGVKTIAFRCGGSSNRELAGAIAIYDGPADLLAHYNESPLVKGI